MTCVMRKKNTHSPCLQSLFHSYLDHRLVRNRSFAYEKIAIGVNTLSKILPDKLYKKLA